MSLKKIHIILITQGHKKEYNLLGEYNEKIISYYETEKLRSKLIIDLENKTLTKENIDYKISLNFKEKHITENEILLKKENSILSIKIETLEYKEEKNKIHIIYKIIDSGEIVEYKIEKGE